MIENNGEPIKMKGEKKRYRVVENKDTKDTGALRTKDYTESDTYLGAIFKLRSIMKLGTNLDEIALEWHAMSETGERGHGDYRYRVEEFYVDDEPEIDWEPVIIECMGHKTWGDPEKCPFCLALGFTREKVQKKEFSCEPCLFTEYLKDNPKSKISLGNPCQQTIPGRCNFTAENFLRVLADMLVWYRKKKESEKK